MVTLKPKFSFLTFILIGFTFIFLFDSFNLSGNVVIFPNDMGSCFQFSTPINFPCAVMQTSLTTKTACDNLETNPSLNIKKTIWMKDSKKCPDELVLNGDVCCTKSEEPKSISIPFIKTIYYCEPTPQSCSEQGGEFCKGKKSNACCTQDFVCPKTSTIPKRAFCTREGNICTGLNSPSPDCCAKGLKCLPNEECSKENSKINGLIPPFCQPISKPEVTSCQHICKGTGKFAWRTKLCGEYEVCLHYQNGYPYCYSDPKNN